MRSRICIFNELPGDTSELHFQQQASRRCTPARPSFPKPGCIPIPHPNFACLILSHPRLCSHRVCPPARITRSLRAAKVAGRFTNYQSSCIVWRVGVSCVHSARGGDGRQMCILTSLCWHATRQGLRGRTCSAFYLKSELP